MLRLYGISIETFELMRAAQGGVCKICLQPEATGRNLSIDHDHTTGKVRGLLCSNCNNGLGRFGDSIERLAAAQRYLIDARGRE